MKNINIRELARELKLSVSSISKALKDSHEISDETKQRVLEMAARLNYIPNPYASSLRGRKSKNIGVVIPEVADSFFALALNGINSVAIERGYHVLICLTHESFENEKNILKEFQSRRVDGVLLSVSSETSQTSHIRDLISNGVPLVFFDRACEEVETARITTNDEESGYQATEHLIQKGCDRIVFLSISQTLSISNKRMEGYLQALSDHGMEPDKKDVILCTNDDKKNYVLIKRVLARKKRPDGVLASGEKLTTPVYKACEALQLKIPRDVKVVCFSNLATASILNPPLTVVRQPAFEMGKAAATVLLKALQKQNINLTKESQVIRSSLIIRKSTS
jgi:LacI family transcriptional regulator